MIRLHPEQLDAQLQESLQSCYLLFGNDLFLLQESQKRIFNKARKKKFKEHFSVILDANTNWDAIFNLCQSLSLFSSRKILLLILSDENISTLLTQKLLQLASFLHEDLLLILRGNKLNRIQEGSTWFKALSQNAVLVTCITPEQNFLPCWLSTQVKNMGLLLDNDAYQSLCYYYEGNLLALVQALERLSLVYPDGRLTLPRVESVVNDATCFTAFHWIDAILAGRSKRAIRMLRQFQLRGLEPMLLLRNIQREVMLLLTLKRAMDKIPTRVLFDQHKIWQNRRQILIQALKRISLTQLRDAIAMMTKIELALKQNYESPLVWFDLSALSLLLCDKILPTMIIND